jgi:hypothetical protein
MRKTWFVAIAFAGAVFATACHNDAKENAANSAESDRDFPDMADTGAIMVDTIGITADTSLTQ